MITSGSTGKSSGTFSPTRRGRALAAALGMAGILGAASLPAQTQTGTLEGRVKGPDGGALPGVEVILSGSAVMGTRKDVTDGAGGFRFPSLLPADDYVVAFALGGFRSTKYENVVVQVGQTTSLAVPLELAAVTDDITVVSTSPVLDVISPTASTHFETDLLSNIPNIQRDWSQSVLQAPGIVDGSKESYNGAMYSSRGGSVVANQAAVDGVINTVPLNNISQGSGTVFETVADVQVITGALPAEIGNLGGAYINVITKSGGNALHGEVGAYYEDASLQSDNVGGGLEQAGLRAAELTDYRDWGLELGGPLVKDALWFDVGWASKKTGNRVSGFPFPDVKEEEYYSGKLTWQPGPSHTITSLYNHSRWEFPYTGGNALITPEATVRSLFETDNFKVKWAGVLSSHLLAEMDLARRETHQANAPQADAGAASTDVLTGLIFGGNPTYFDIDYRRDLPKASLSLFVPDWHGSHQVKIGVEYEDSTSNFRRYGSSPVFLQLPGLGAVAGLPFDLVQMWNQANGVLSKFEMEGLHGYLQDAWSLSPRMTLSLGARLNTWEGRFPEQGNEGFSYGPFVNFPAQRVDHETTAVDWTSFEPRLAASVVLDEKARTVLRLGLARYHHGLDMSYFQGANPNGVILSTNIWVDLDGDGFADPNEVFTPLAVNATGGPIDEGLKNPYTDELTVGIGRELFADASVTVNATWRRDRDLIDDVNSSLGPSSYAPTPRLDPGPDGQPGTADDSVITLFNQVANLGTPNVLTVTNPDRAKRDYHGVELIFAKRMSNRWQALASFVRQRATGTLQTNRNDASGISAVFNDPNTLINISGPVVFDTRLQLKLLGTYQAPHQISVSGYWLYRTGTPLYRTINVVLNQGGPIPVVLDPKDSHRQDDLSRLDLRVEKVIGLGGRPLQLGLSVDVFNVFNEDAVTDRNSLTTPAGAFGRPLAVQDPRTLRLGARLRF